MNSKILLLIIISVLCLSLTHAVIDPDIVDLQLDVKNGNLLCDLTGGNKQEKTVQWMPLNCEFSEDEPFQSAFYLSLIHDQYHQCAGDTYSTGSGCGLQDQYNYPCIKFDYYYNLYACPGTCDNNINYGGSELPYYIKECYVSCGGSEDNTYKPLTGSASQTNLARVQSVYECDYTNEDKGKTVYHDIICEYEFNPDHQGQINPPCQFLPPGAITTGNTFNISKYAYLGDDILIVPFFGYNNDNELIILEHYQISMVLDNSTGDMIVKNTTLTKEFNESFDTDVGSDTSNKQKDELGIRKQLYYNSQIQSAQKKNEFVSYFINLCELLFSLVLVFYYIMALTILVFIIGTWFPNMIRFPVEFIKKLGGNK